MNPGNACPLDHDRIEETLNVCQGELQHLREEVQMLRRENRNLKYTLDAVLEKATTR